VYRIKITHCSEEHPRTGKLQGSSYLIRTKVSSSEYELALAVSHIIEPVTVQKDYLKQLCARWVGYAGVFDLHHSQGWSV
jgi:hypothetical protein